MAPGSTSRSDNTKTDQINCYRPTVEKTAQLFTTPRKRKLAQLFSEYRDNPYFSKRKYPSLEEWFADLAVYIGESYRSRHEEFTAKDIQDWYLAEPEFFKESAAKVVLSSSDQGFQTGMEKSDDDHDDTNSVEALPTSSMIHPPNPTSFVVEQPGGTLADSQSFQEVIPREAEWVRHSSCVLGQSMQPQIDYAVRNPNSKPLKVYRLKGSVLLKSSQTETGIRRELLNVVRTCYHRYQELKEQVQRNGSGGDPLYQDGTECRINKAETALIALRHELAEMDRVWKESQSH